MKIAFLGNFGVDYSSETHYLKTLTKHLGHDVIALQEGVSQSTEILNAAVNSDVFFWVHTHGWNTPGMAEVLDILKQNNVPSVGYHLDLWKGLRREIDLENDPYWKIEYFFTCDPNFIPDLEAKGIKAYFNPAGVFEDECFIGDVRPEYEHDVIFVGSRNYHEEWPYRKQLIEWLEATYGDRFAQYGNGGRGTIRGKDLNDLYASAKVVVGDTLCKNYNYPGYFSDRIFETTGRGGFIVHPYIQGVEKLFKVMENFKFINGSDEIVTYNYGEFDDLKNRIDFFLQHDNVRKKIQLNGFNRTKKDHTYRQRLKYILDTIKK